MLSTKAIPTTKVAAEQAEVIKAVDQAAVAVHPEVAVVAVGMAAVGMAAAGMAAAGMAAGMAAAGMAAGIDKRANLAWGPVGE